MINQIKEINIANFISVVWFYLGTAFFLMNLERLDLIELLYVFKKRKKWFSGGQPCKVCEFNLGLVISSKYSITLA